MTITLPEHSARGALIDELHARPFIPLPAPARVVHLAFIPEDGEAPASNAEKLDHLAALLTHLGAPPPAGARIHYVAEIDDFMVRWERHTEFVTISLIDLAPRDEDAFTPTPLSRAPRGWLESAPGRVISASLVEVTLSASREEAERRMGEELDRQLERASFAAAFVVDRLALVATDFRRDDNGFVRMAVLAEESLGPRRLGRVTQRVLELETYRSLSMLALPVARGMGGRLAELDAALERLTREASAGGGLASERHTLESLTRIAAELETLSASSAYRFSAARAYSEIVDERLAVLREERALARQTFTEFMTRRYRPAMRSCWATIDRLDSLMQRAERAANLLRTRVDVSLEAQNQELLRSMDRRARLQLRLQQTVEGLSVVAISYYAVSLAGYVLAPLAKAIGSTETMAKAVVALPIIAAVWFMIRRIRHHVEANAEPGGQDEEIKRGD